MTEHTSRHARRIAAVTFDCWGTLIEVRDGTAATHRRIDVLAARAGIDRERATVFIEQGRAEHFAEWLAGRHYGAAGIARFCMEKVGVSDETASRSFRQELEQASLANEFVLLPGAERTLAVLKASGIRTAVICDTGLTPGWVTRRVLTDLGVERGIDAFAFSDDVGMPKPHARIFEAALDALGVKPSATVHVGDMLRTDIAGARALGMATVRITAVTPDGGVSASAAAGVPLADPAARHIPEADEVVGSHAELIDALERLDVRFAS